MSDISFLGLPSEPDNYHRGSRKLDKIPESIIQLGDENRTGFRTVSSQLSQTMNQLDAEVKAGFSAVSFKLTGTDSANEIRHQEVLGHLGDHTNSHVLNTEKLGEISQRQKTSMDTNEAGFRAIQSSMVSASSSSFQEHKTTHAMLSQYQGYVQQILRDRITFGTAQRIIHPTSTRTPAVDHTTTETTVFWKYCFHRLPIGTLHTHLKKTRKLRSSRRSAPQGRIKSEIAVEFVPPPWLSSVVIQFSTKLSCDLIGSQWRWGATLEPLTVNNSPYFLQAVESCDVEGVRRLFAEGLAKPTDYIISYDGFPIMWYYFVCLVPAYYRSMLNFSR